MQKQNSVFGLDIGYESVKIVEVKENNGRVSLVGAIEMPLKNRILEKDSFKNKADAANQIKEAMRQAKPSAISARHFVSSLPETYVFTKTIQLPKMSVAELERAIPNEAAEFLPIPVENVYFDYQVLMAHPDEPLMDIFIAAAPKRLVDDYLELAKIAGLELVALETKSFASGRAILRQKGLPKGVLILHIGTEFSRISIWDGGTIRLSSTVSVGKNQIVGGLNNFVAPDQEGVALTPERYGNIAQIASPIMDEIAAAVKYHQTRDFKPSPIEKIVLCGSSLSIEGLGAFIESEMKVPTETAKLKLNEKEELSPQFIAAFGLALRKAEE